jgi:ABC-type glycerol-3-phosphate transport system substrate-binding protein
MKSFQLIVLVTFSVFLVIGVLIFSGIIKLPGGGGNTAPGVSGTVVIWGTLPAVYFEKPLNDFNIAHQGDSFSVRYVEKDQSTFDTNLIESLAAGVGPDLVLLPQDLLLRHASKIYPIPLQTISERDFKNIFIEEGELFFLGGNALAIPFTVDPMMLYWNRDSFSSAGFTKPPLYWEEFFSIVPQLTTKDNSANILKSGLAFGEAGNIVNAKDILAMLIMQAGSKIISYSPERGVEVVLGQNNTTGSKAGEAALQFYSEFSNPVKAHYSWNRSLPTSRNMFLSGDLAMYFGYASEIGDLRARNPHLNFDVAMVPQTKGATKKTTFGRMYGLATLKSSTNLNTALYTETLLSQVDFMKNIPQYSYLPPTRRDLLTTRPSDPYLSIFYDAAIISAAWLDPSPKETNSIFATMINNVVSGRFRPQEAVSDTASQLEKLIK